MFVNKTPTSTSLSHSDGAERLQVFSTAQRTSRKSSKKSCEEKGVTNETTCSSCLGSERRRAKIKTSCIAQLQAIPATTPDVAMNRNQLTAHFFDMYYPATLPSRTTIVDKLRQWMQPEHGAVALAAADSMILLHAAQSTGDANSRKNGMRRYSMALQLLRDELQNPESAHNDSVLGAVEIMGVVETRLLKSLEDNRDSISRAHTRGLYALVHARGPVTLQSSVGKDILLQHLHGPLMVSLIARRASIFGNPDWQKAFQDTGDDDRGKMYQLTALGCCVPEAFEKVDVTINNAAATSIDYMNVLTKLIKLEDRFLVWLLDRYRRLSSGEPYRICTASLSTPSYNLPAELMESYPFPVVVEYDSFMDLLAHLNYWGLLLMLRRTILDVLIALEFAHPDSASLDRSSHVRVKCSEVADLFCQSICYVYGLPKHQRMVARQGMVAFLIAIIPWYEFDRDDKKVDWCRILLRAFQDGDKDLELVEPIQHTWVTKLYVGWVNMAF